MARTRDARDTAAPTPPGRHDGMVISGAIAVVVIMFPVFRATDALLGNAVDGYLGWFVGLAIYWLLAGIAFSVWAIGTRRIAALARPRRPTADVLLFVGIPLAFAAAERTLIAGSGYERASAAATVLLVATALGNGVFEEVFWRGVYLERFGDRWPLQMAWPSVWFGVWHLAPGSVGSGGGSVAVLMVGAMFFGLYLAFVARRTGSVWWPIVTHATAGLILVL